MKTSFNSFLDPRVCGYAKVAALHVDKTSWQKVSKGPRGGDVLHKSRVKSQQYSDFNEIFSDRQLDFSIDFQQFAKRLPSIKELFARWKGRDYKNKVEYLDTFSVENWKKLSSTKKNEHTLQDCKACFDNHTKLCPTFPTKSPTNEAAGKENPFTASKQFKTPSLTAKTLKDATLEIYSEVNTRFKKAFNISFFEAQTKVPI